MSTAAAKRYLYSHFNADQTKIGPTSTTPSPTVSSGSSFANYSLKSQSQLIDCAKSISNLSSETESISSPSSTTTDEHCSTNVASPLSNIGKSSAFSVPTNQHRNNSPTSSTTTILLSPSSLISSLRINNSPIEKSIPIQRKRFNQELDDLDDNEENDLEQELMLDAHVPVISSAPNKKSLVSFGPGSGAELGNVFVPVLLPQQEIIKAQQLNLKFASPTTISTQVYQHQQQDTSFVNSASATNLNVDFETLNYPRKLLLMKKLSQENSQTKNFLKKPTSTTTPTITGNQITEKIDRESPFSLSDEGIDDMEDMMMIDHDSSPATATSTSSSSSSSSSTTISTSSIPAPSTSKAKIRRTLYQCTWRGCNFQCLQCHIIERHVRVIHLGRSSSSSSTSSSTGATGAATELEGITQSLCDTPTSTTSATIKSSSFRNHRRRLAHHVDSKLLKSPRNDNNADDQESVVVVVDEVDEDDDNGNAGDDDSDREEEFYYNELEIIDDHYSPTLSLKSSSAVSSLSSPNPMSPPGTVALTVTTATTTTNNVANLKVANFNSNQPVVAALIHSQSKLETDVHQNKSMQIGENFSAMEIDDENDDKVGLPIAQNQTNTTSAVTMATSDSNSIKSVPNSHHRVISLIDSYPINGPCFPAINNNNQLNRQFKNFNSHSPHLIHRPFSTTTTSTMLAGDQDSQDGPIDLSSRSKLNTTISGLKTKLTTSSSSSSTSMFHPTMTTTNSTLPTSGSRTPVSFSSQSSNMVASLVSSTSTSTSTSLTMAAPSLHNLTYSTLPKSMLIPIPIVGSTTHHHHHPSQLPSPSLSTHNSKLFQFQSSNQPNHHNHHNHPHPGSTVTGNGNGSISTSPFSSASSSSSSAYYSSSPTSSTKSWSGQLDDHPTSSTIITTTTGNDTVLVAHPPTQQSPSTNQNIDKIRSANQINPLISLGVTSTTSTPICSSSTLSSAIFSLPNLTIFSSSTSSSSSNHGLSSSSSYSSPPINGSLTNSASTNQTSETVSQHQQVLNRESNVIKFGVRNNNNNSTPSLDQASKSQTAVNGNLSVPSSILPNHHRISLEHFSSQHHQHHLNQLYHQQNHHHNHNHNHQHHQHQHQSPAAAALAALNRHLSLQSQQEQQQQQVAKQTTAQVTTQNHQTTPNVNSNNSGAGGAIPTVPRRRGRPPGSTNKKKKLMLEQQQQAAQQHAAAQQQFLMSLGIPPNASATAASSIIASISPNSAAAAAAAAALLKQHLHNKANQQSHQHLLHHQQLHPLDQAQIDKILLGGATFGNTLAHLNGGNAGGNGTGSGRRPRGESRKCRKVYGMDHRELWCTQCKWKKACSRFTD